MRIRDNEVLIFLRQFHISLLKNIAYDERKSLKFMKKCAFKKYVYVFLQPSHRLP